MPKIQCEIPGFEDVTIIYPDPDEWTMLHCSRYDKGVGRAGLPFFTALKKNKDAVIDGDLLPSRTEELLFGIAALVEVEGLDVDLKTISLSDVRKLKPYYLPFIKWLIEEVGGAYERSKSPPAKN